MWKGRRARDKELKTGQLVALWALEGRAGRATCSPSRLIPRLPMVVSTCKRGSNFEGENLRKLLPGGLGHVGRGTCYQQVSSEAGSGQAAVPADEQPVPRCLSGSLLAPPAPRLQGAGLTGSDAGCRQRASVSFARS